ncbi:MAG TPA: alpha/beta hydrolase [Povalibacter sp.]|nr:alpha/beta hydrolase [Povalibacter sp.]
MIRCIDRLRRIAITSSLLGAFAATSAFAAEPLPQCPPAAGSGAGAHELIVDGVRLWYCVAGKPTAGVPPLVFLHGGPGYSSYSFAALAGPQLERELQVVYLDQRGSGYSERPWTRDYALPRLIEDVEVLRRALGAERIAVMGHSFGGTLALEYAAAHPERVSNLILVSAAIDLPAACHARVEWLAAHSPAQLQQARAAQKVADDCALAFNTLQGDAFRKYNDQVMFPDSRSREQQERVDAASGQRNTGELAQALMEGGLLSYRFSNTQRLTMPVLVLGGQFDSAIGLDQQRKLAEAVPHGRFELYRRGGHFLYLDEPEHFVRDVVGFVRSPSSAGPGARTVQ